MNFLVMHTSYPSCTGGAASRTLRTNGRGVARIDVFFSAARNGVVPIHGNCRKEFLVFVNGATARRTTPRSSRICFEIRAGGFSSSRDCPAEPDLRTTGLVVR